jgi:hypothetical protein
VIWSTDALDESSMPALREGMAPARSWVDGIAIPLLHDFALRSVHDACVYDFGVFPAVFPAYHLRSIRFRDHTSEV